MEEEEQVIVSQEKVVVQKTIRKQSKVQSSEPKVLTMFIIFI